MMMLDLPTAPGALLGYRRDGRPFYLIAGGSGEDDGPDDDGTGNDDHNDASAGNDDGGGSNGSDDTDDGQDDADDQDSKANGKPNSGDPKAQRVISAIRADLKSEKAKRRAAEQAAADHQAKIGEFQKALDDLKADQQSRNDAIAKALGLKEDDAPPDPAKLAEQVATAQAEAEKARNDAQAEIAARDERIKAMAVEKAVLLHADKLGGDAQALLDSRSFGARVEGFDPDGDDFAEQLKAAIMAAVEDDPRLKKPEPKPKRSGGEFNGSPRGRQRPKSLSEAVRGAYGGGS